MNPLTTEWVQKAEGDFLTSQRELRARNAPNYDAVCFHAQQYAEKYLKAFLQENNIAIPKTHHLLDLLGLGIKIDSSFQLLYSDLNLLEGYAVKFRYPGDTATKLDARMAVRAARAVRMFIRNKLELVA